MKSSIHLILTIVLLFALLTPSLMVLTQNIEKSGIVFDFNEEEKKEVSEKDLFLNANLDLFLALQADKTNIPSFCMVSDYSTSLSIFLLPPKQTT